MQTLNSDKHAHAHSLLFSFFNRDLANTEFYLNSFKVDMKNKAFEICLFSHFGTVYSALTRKEYENQILKMFY